MKTAGNYLQKAAELSTDCFFNSLLKEWPDFSVDVFEDGKCVTLRLDEAGSLKLPLSYHSTLGRHRYQGRYLLESRGGVRDISFEDAIGAVSKFLGKKLNINDETVRQFKKRALMSRDTIYQTLTHRSSFLDDLSLDRYDFKDAEQSLVVGHNFHPTPKSRDEFSEEDMKEYSPELGGSFRIEWFLAHPSIVHQNRAISFERENWLEELLIEDLGRKLSLDVEDVRWIPFPMHPWQKRVLLENPVVSGYVENHLLRPVGASREKWYPTSSLRSVYRQSSQYMLKFSMTLKLTNSIRHLLLREVERGLQLKDVLATALGEKFKAENPDFKVITEPAYVALKNLNGEPMSETFVVCRENPFGVERSTNKIVLATLAQDPPLGSENLLQKFILQAAGPADLRLRSQMWFARYLELAVKPLLLAQSNYGFLLGAHQQNLILEIDKGWPVGVFFRDCQGTGYSALGYSHFSGQVASIDPDNGNVLNEKMGNYLFSYYLIINSTFNVITAIASKGWIEERELLQDLRSFLEEIRAGGVKDSGCLDYLLEDEALMHKGNFFCSFKAINENTAEDPLSIYTRIANPLHSRFLRGLTHA